MMVNIYCFSCKYTHYSKAIHNRSKFVVPTAITVSAANIHIIRKQFTTKTGVHPPRSLLFQLQIYTLFESNSQQAVAAPVRRPHCFSCKYTHYSKAIHNSFASLPFCSITVSAANIHIIRKQFTTHFFTDMPVTKLFQLQIYTLFESNSQLRRVAFDEVITVSAANIHIIRKQFTTQPTGRPQSKSLFQLQIYTLFVSNSQLCKRVAFDNVYCFSCKYTHYSKAIHNLYS